MNKKVMSIAIKPELHDELKKYAKRKVTSTSAYVGDLIEKALELNIDDDPFIIGKSPDEPDPVVVRRTKEEDALPVVLKIPKKLRGNAEQLKIWMDAQTNGIIGQLCK